MRDDIYLTRLQLSQFRSFASLDIQLPPEPGVLIVHGSNGLGKSSLFDGLEWGLSDQIDHFRNARGVKKVGNYLSRWREDATDPTRVAMTFSDGGTIERSLASPESVTSTLAGTVNDITAYLRADGWHQSISALPNYLLLTHILGQSTLSRLTHRDASERFDILKEAAQSREVEAIATALHGRGNTVTVRAFARRMESLEKDVARFTELLDQEDRLWSAAQGSGAIDDGQAIAMIAEVREAIGAALHETGSTPGSISGDLDRLETALDDARAILRNEEAQLGEAARLVEVWRQHSVTQAAARSALAQTLGELTSLAADRAAATNDKAAVELEHAAALAASATTRLETELLTALLKTRRARVQTEVNLGNVRQPLTDAESWLADATARLDRAQRRSRIALRLDAELTRIDQEEDRLQNDVDRLRIWKTGHDAFARHTAALIELESEHPGLAERLRDAETEMANIAVDIDAQVRTLSLLQETATSLAGAVATIAATMPHETCECPVCATRFGDASQLRDRVDGAAQRLNPALVSQESALAASRRRLQDVQARIEAYRSTQDQIQSQRSQLAAARDIGSRQFERIRHLGDVAADFDAVMQGITTEQQRLSTRRARKIFWIQVLRDPSDSENDLQNLVRIREEAKAARERCARELADRSSDLARHDAQIEAIEGRLGQGRPGLVQPLSGPALGEAFDTARRRHESALDREAQVRSKADFEIERLRRIDAAETASRARRRELDSQIAEMEIQLGQVAHRWTELGFATAEPSDNDISDRSTRVAGRARRLAGAGDALERLRSGRRAWGSQVTHRAALDSLRAVIDAAPTSGREEIRSAAQRLRAARALAATQTQEAKTIALAASQDILSELEDFNAEYIQPLDSLMKRINQAILTDPRVGIDLQVVRKKIEQNAVKTGDLPSSLGGIDPALIHSEGQMSALAVSLLCAASITFPWSRWPALLLDDPMQHNDAIHTAAFADLICNLVEQRGYQVLLSTHDQGQAEFLQRKCAARSVPCGVLSLLGTGRDGVEADFRAAIARGAGSTWRASITG